jgi:Family of unknown function (DUF6319)
MPTTLPRLPGNFPTERGMPATMTTEHVKDGPNADDTSPGDQPLTVSPDPAPDTVEEESPNEPVKRKRGRPKGQVVVRKAPAVELTLTVIGTADGDWHAELRHGATWIARNLPIPASAVSRAAKELHDDLANPINEVIQAARSQQQARVAELEAELEKARKALAELDN